MIRARMGEIEFDDELLEQKIEQTKRIGARRVGFQTRETAMNSITDGAGPAKPGQPPHSHTGILRRFITYDYETESSAVVIGPKLLNRRSKNVAEATEGGGIAKSVSGRQVRVAARPFMSPAFDKVNRTSVPKVFENTFH